MFDDPAEVGADELHLVVLVVLDAVLTSHQVSHVLLAQFYLGIYLGLQLVRELLQLLHLLEMGVRCRYLVRLQANCEPRRVIHRLIELFRFLSGIYSRSCFLDR